VAHETWSKYGWLDADASDDLTAGCIGVVIGSDGAAVRRVLGTDEEPIADATVGEASRLSQSDFGNDLVQIAALGEAVVTFEPNGWHGVDHQVAAALSAGGRYASYFWNVNAVKEFIFAEAGAIRRNFDPLLYDNDRQREHALPEELDLPFPSEGRPLTPATASLALIERLTGVEITREWLLEGRRSTYRIDPES
jgi:hypothetical protein